jgi:hypothetical protein
MKDEKGNTKRLKKQHRNNSRLIRILTVSFLLFFGNLAIYAQIKGESNVDSIKVKKVIIRKDKNKKVLFADSAEFYYVALNYNYTDSVSLFIDGKNIYNGKMNYLQPDSNSTWFPFNRALLRLPKGYIGRNSKCQIIFRGSKQKVVFSLDKRFRFYTLGVHENVSPWYLHYLNARPWPD